MKIERREALRGLGGLVAAAAFGKAGA